VYRLCVSIRAGGVTAGDDGGLVIQAVAVFGGAGKWEQQKLLKEGCEILVATPGNWMLGSSVRSG
jgi:superfamily II DNA/RNA helicase